MIKCKLVLAMYDSHFGYSEEEHHFNLVRHKYNEKTWQKVVDERLQLVEDEKNLLLLNNINKIVRFKFNYVIILIIQSKL